MTDGRTSAGATLSGIGITGPPTVSISPLTHDFGPQRIGASSGPKTFTVRNVRVTASNTVRLGGMDSVQFAIVRNSCVPSSAEFETCEIDIVFSPTRTGLLRAALGWKGNPGGSATASFTGVGMERADAGMDAN